MTVKVEAVPEPGPRRVRQVLSALLVLGALALMMAAVATVFALDASAAISRPTTGSTTRYTLTGDRIAIFNLAGRVTIEAGRGPDVIVEVTPAGRDADRLSVQTGMISGHNTLRVITPSDRIVYPDLEWGSNSNSGVRDDGTFGGFSHKSGWLAPWPREWVKHSRRVTVSRRGTGLEAWAIVRVLMPPGRSVEAHLLAGRADVAHVNGNVALDLGAASATADGIHGSLLLDTGSGEVDARNVTGDLDLDTGSGRVHVNAVKGGRVNVDTGSGEVDGQDIEADILGVDTGSGSVHLSGVSAPDITVDTGSGEVELGLLTDIRTLNVDTGSGGVTLRVPRDLGAEIEMDSGSGGFDSDLPMQVIRRDESYLKGKIGDGRGRITIDTGSGGVKLRAI